MKQKSIIKNYIYNLIYQLLVLILPLITTPYLSRVLGTEGTGIYSYTISIVTYFTLLGSLGVAVYAQREIAYVQGEPEKRSIIFWEVILLRTVSLSFAMVIFFLVFVKNGEYSEYYKILILEIISAMVDISAFFQGMEEFKKIIKRNLIVKCVSIICIFIFVKQPTDLWKYILIYTLSNFVGNISLWFYLPKYITKIKISSLNILRHIKPIIMLFVPQIAIQIYTVLDKTMIGALILDKSEVGYYEQAQKIVKMLLTVITSLGTVMLPRIANQFANGEDKKIKDSIVKSINYVFFLSVPMVFGLITVAKDLIPWFLGDEFVKSIYIIYVISPIILFIGLSSVIGAQYLLPTKKQKEYTISVVAGSIINLILNFIFIPKFMSIGAAIGTVIAEFMVVFIQLIYVRKEFKFNDIFISAYKYFISGAIMFITLLTMNRLILVYISNVIVKMLIEVVVGCLVYVIILMALKDEFTFNILNKISKYIKRGEKI